ncbi:ZMYND11 [Cordylochernes scorpioides]|uniref:ZMYND11 n=1 Tax=Cordylochernes scorpioides TaxID=51811 RepID=A0ABY6LFE2_9ARAC|nr:ZMYND11 [Cordylochernes scorpioides]
MPYAWTMVVAVRRRATLPLTVQKIWDAILYIRQQKQVSNLTRIAAYMRRVHGLSEEQVKTDLDSTVEDGLIVLEKRMGCKGSKAGVPQEGYKIPDGDVKNEHTKKKDRQAIELLELRLHMMFYIGSADVNPLINRQESMGQDSVSVVSTLPYWWLHPAVGVQEKDDHDWYCFECHLGGEMLLCSQCHRVYHPDCLTEVEMAKFICPVCRMMVSKNEYEHFSQKYLNQLLSYTCVRLKEKTKLLHKMPGPDVDLWRYNQLVYATLDLNDMEDKVRACSYVRMEEYLADAKTILHAIMVYYGSHCLMAGLGIQMLGDCEYDLAEIQQCNNCYRMSNDKKTKYWFCQPCNICKVFPLFTKCNYQPATQKHIIDCIDSSIDELYSVSPADTINKLYRLDILILLLSGDKKEEVSPCAVAPQDPPHDLVYAKQRGFPYWPAKVIKVDGDNYDVRFFGNFHQRWVWERYSLSVLPLCSDSHVDDNGVTLALHSHSSPKCFSKEMLRRATVEKSQIQPISADHQKIGLKKTPAIARALDELQHHQKLLQANGHPGPITPSPPRAPRGRHRKRGRRRDDSPSSSSPPAKVPKAATSPEENNNVVSSSSPFQEVIKVSTASQTDLEGEAPPAPECSCNTKYSKVFREMEERLVAKHKDDKEGCLKELTKKLEMEFEASKTAAVAAALTKLEQGHRKTEEQIRAAHQAELARIAEQHRLLVSETKKKQWCYNCEAEAIYHCCWNTSYCSVECQQQHWHKEHKRTCRRKR